MLAAIHFLANDSGVIPSYREIAAFVGIGLGTTVHHLNRLVEGGAIAKDPGKKRALRLVRIEGEDPIQVDLVCADCGPIGESANDVLPATMDAHWRQSHRPAITVSHRKQLAESRTS